MNNLTRSSSTKTKAFAPTINKKSELTFLTTNFNKVN